MYMYDWVPLFTWNYQTLLTDYAPIENIKVLLKNHYAIYFKLMQCCMSIISQYNWKKKNLSGKNILLHLPLTTQKKNWRWNKDIYKNNKIRKTERISLVDLYRKDYKRGIYWKNIEIIQDVSLETTEGMKNNRNG